MWTRRFVSLSFFLPLVASLSVQVDKHESASELAAEVARVKTMAPDMKRITEKLYNEIADLQAMEEDENVPADMLATVKQMKEKNVKVVQSFQEMRAKVETMPSIKTALERVDLSKEHLTKPVSGLFQVSTESEASGALLHASGSAAAIAKTALERLERADSREETDSLSSSFLQLSVEDQESEGERQAEELVATMLQREQEKVDAKTQLEELAMKMEMRVGRAMQKSARIDALVDAAIMSYLESPEEIQAVETAPTVSLLSLLDVASDTEEDEMVEHVTGGKDYEDPYTLSDFVYNLFGQQDGGTEEDASFVKVHGFADHPFVRSRRMANTYASTLPSENVQLMLLDQVLWRLNKESKVVMIHINLSEVEDNAHVKAQLLCIKNAIQELQATEPMLMSFVVLSGGSTQRRKDMLEIAEGELPGVMELDGEDEAKNYFMALADVLYRVGSAPASGERGQSTASFALQSAHAVEADSQQSVDRMCTIDSKDVSESMQHTKKHFAKLNQLMSKLDEEDLKPKADSMLGSSFVEKEAQVEVSTKNTQKGAVTSKFSLAAGFGAAHTLKNTGKHQRAVFSGHGQVETGDSEESLRSRRPSWRQVNAMPQSKRIM